METIYRLAESQAGYFTASQAIDAGMGRRLLNHHARRDGPYETVRPGLYRLRQFPSSRHEHIVAAWLPLQRVGAVVSHASALDIYGLSDTIPDTIHMSVPREKRGVRPRTGVRIHTLAAPLDGNEIRQEAGVQVTSPERSIVDALEDGAQPEQVEMAVQQALDRGLTTQRRLREAAESRSDRVRTGIESAISRSAV